MYAKHRQVLALTKRSPPRKLSVMWDRKIYDKKNAKTSYAQILLIPEDFENTEVLRCDLFQYSNRKIFRWKIVTLQNLLLKNFSGTKRPLTNSFRQTQQFLTSFCSNFLYGSPEFFPSDRTSKQRQKLHETLKTSTSTKRAPLLILWYWDNMGQKLTDVFDVTLPWFIDTFTPDRQAALTLTCSQIGLVSIYNLWRRK